MDSKRYSSDENGHIDPTAQESMTMTEELVEVDLMILFLRYRRPSDPAEKFERLYQETQEPIMICVHQSSFNTPEHSNVMWNTLPDMASIDRAYSTYTEQGFASSFLIGYNRCQYIDRYKCDDHIESM